MSWYEAAERLKQLRDDKERRSKEVVDLGEGLVKSYASRLGDDRMSPGN